MCSHVLTERGRTPLNKMLSKDSFHSKSQQIYEYRLFLKLLPLKHSVVLIKTHKRGNTYLLYLMPTLCLRKFMASGNYEKATPTHFWWSSTASTLIEEMLIIDL